MRGLLGRPDTKQVTSGLGFTRRLKMAVKSKNSVCLSPQQRVRLTFSWISPETPKPEDKRTGMSMQGQSIHSKIPSGLRLNCFQIMHILFLIEIELHHRSTFFIPSADMPHPTLKSFLFLWLYLLHMYMTHVCVCKSTYICMKYNLLNPLCCLCASSWPMCTRQLTRWPLLAKANPCSLPPAVNSYLQFFVCG